MKNKSTWAFFPLTATPPCSIRDLVAIFDFHANEITSTRKDLISDEVLAIIRADLEEIGYAVEKGKKKEEKIYVPVLYGIDGKVEKAFNADAFNENEKIVLEVEAGRAVENNQFLKDLFQACVMKDVEYLAIAVRKEYRGKKNFNSVFQFFDTLYKSQRLTLPLGGILLIGY